jgi:hypothetical protein
MSIKDSDEEEGVDHAHAEDPLSSLPIARLLSRVQRNGNGNHKVSAIYIYSIISGNSE